MRQTEEILQKKDSSAERPSIVVKLPRVEEVVRGLWYSTLKSRVKASFYISRFGGNIYETVEPTRYRNQNPKNEVGVIEHFRSQVNKNVQEPLHEFSCLRPL